MMPPRGRPVLRAAAVPLSLLVAYRRVPKRVTDGAPGGRSTNCCVRQRIPCPTDRTRWPGHSFVAGGNNSATGRQQRERCRRQQRATPRAKRRTGQADQTSSQKATAREPTSGQADREVRRPRAASSHRPTITLTRKTVALPDHQHRGEGGHAPEAVGVGGGPGGHESGPEHHQHGRAGPAPRRAPTAAPRNVG